MKAVLPAAVAQNWLRSLMMRSGLATVRGGKVHTCEQLSPTAAGYDRYHHIERETLADACVQLITTERSEPYLAVASFMNPHDVCGASDFHVGHSAQPPVGSIDNPDDGA